MLGAEFTATPCLPAPRGLPRSPARRTSRPRSYDAVVCLDVLEHVSNPVATVAALATALADGGHLFVQAPFFSISPESSTHLSANRRLSGRLRGLYRPFGLSPVDGRSLESPGAPERGDEEWVPAGSQRIVPGELSCFQQRGFGMALTCSPNGFRFG